MADCLKIVLVCVLASSCNLVETADITYMRTTITEHFSENRNHRVNMPYKEAALGFIVDEFTRFGLDIQYNNFSFDPSLFLSEHLKGVPFSNVIGLLEGSRFGTVEDRLVGVGAHYDTVMDTKGVDDNGSGMAAMLECARQITQMNVKRKNTIMFIAFDLKEYGSTQFMSNWIVPWATREYGTHEVLFQSYGGFILDSLMEYDTSENSQSVPPTHNTYFPDSYASTNGYRGDFVHMIYREPTNDTRLASVFESYWTKGDGDQFGIRALPLNATEIGPSTDGIIQALPVVFRGDHISLWSFNIPAVLLTDSGNLRGDMRQCYHRMCDDVETMLTDDNLNFLGKTADTIVKTLAVLSEPDTGASSADKAIPSTLLLCWLYTLTIFK